MKHQPQNRSLAVLVAAAFFVPSLHLRADCTLTNVGITPLNDLGFGIYKGKPGGLYPGGANARPPAHELAGLNIATNQIVPRDAGGTNTTSGKIVLLFICMSHTTED